MSPGANLIQSNIRGTMGTPQEPSITSQSNYQQSPGYNGLVNANTPGEMESFEPMAANAALGGGGFDSHGKFNIIKLKLKLY